MTAHNLVYEETNIILWKRKKTIYSAIIKSMWEKERMTLRISGYSEEDVSL
jgi:hypothetical protein